MPSLKCSPALLAVHCQSHIGMFEEDLAAMHSFRNPSDSTKSKAPVHVDSGRSTLTAIEPSDRNLSLPGVTRSTGGMSDTFPIDKVVGRTALSVYADKIGVQRHVASHEAVVRECPTLAMKISDPFSDPSYDLLSAEIAIARAPGFSPTGSATSAAGAATERKPRMLFECLLAPARHLAPDLPVSPEIGDREAEDFLAL